MNTKTYLPFILLPKVHVMNVYTGDIFFNNVAYQQARFLKTGTLVMINENFKFSTKLMAALMSYFQGGKYSTIKINGKNIDLIKKRSDIALYCHKEKKMEIFGKG